MSEQPTYTEAEVNKMLGDQRTNLRLDGIDDSIKELLAGMTAHMDEEKHDADEIRKILSEGSNERRHCELKIRKDMTDMNDQHHKVFVKKTDLKVYATIIIAAVTMTTGFITWVGTRNTNIAYDDSVRTVIEKIEVMLESRPRP